VASLFLLSTREILFRSSGSAKNYAHVQKPNIRNQYSGQGCPIALSLPYLSTETTQKQKFANYNGWGARGWSPTLSHYTLSLYSRREPEPIVQYSHSSHSPSQLLQIMLA
jgi:hypothetical protein